MYVDYILYLGFCRRRLMFFFPNNLYFFTSFNSGWLVHDNCTSLSSLYHTTGRYCTLTLLFFISALILHEHLNLIPLYLKHFSRTLVKYFWKVISFVVYIFIFCPFVYHSTSLPTKSFRLKDYYSYFLTLFSLFYLLHHSYL